MPKTITCRVSEENPWSSLTRSCSMRRFKVSLAAKITSCASLFGGGSEEIGMFSSSNHQQN